MKLQGAEQTLKLFLLIKVIITKAGVISRETLAHGTPAKMLAQFEDSSPPKVSCIKLAFPSTRVRVTIVLL